MYPIQLMSFLLLGTQGCHLCEEAQALLTQLAIPVDNIDIANDTQWQTEFCFNSCVIPFHITAIHSLAF